MSIQVETVYHLFCDVCHRQHPGEFRCPDDVMEAARAHGTFVYHHDYQTQKHRNAWRCNECSARANIRAVIAKAAPAPSAEKEEK